MPERNYQPETWTNAGQRVSSSGKAAQAWIDADGTERIYIERETYVIGGMYVVQVAREGDHVWRSDQPAYRDKIPDTDLIRTWAALSRAAGEQLRALGRERTAKTDDALNEALAPLMDIFAGIQSGADRRALLAYVNERLATAYQSGQIDRMRRDAAADGRAAAAAIRAARRTGGAK
jgi:hypothetical protein